MGMFDKDPSELEVLESKFKKAKQWCKDTRDILKIETSWYKKDVKGDEYGTLKDLSNKVTKRLEKLKGNGAYKALMLEFIDQTSMLEKAEGSKNKGLATSLLDNLTILDLKIDVVEGKVAPEVVGKTREKVVEKDKLEFERMLQSAKQTEEFLKTLGDENHRFVGVVPNLIVDAQSKFDTKKIENAFLVLGNVQIVRVDQEERYRRYLKYVRRMEEVEGLQEEFRLFPPDKSKELSDLISASKKMASEGSKDYKAAYDILKTADAVHGKVKKTLSEEDKKNFENLVKAQSSFEEKYEKLLGQVNILKASRATEDGSDTLEKASGLLLETKQKVASAVSVESLEWASKDAFEKVEEYIKLAENEKVLNKERSNANLKAMPEFLEKLHKAENALENLNALFSVDEEKKKLKQLIQNAKNQLKPKGDLVFGYVEALDVISGYKEIVKAATQKSLNHSTAELPQEIKLAADEVEKRIQALENPPLLSPVEAAFFRESLQALVQKGDQKTILPTKENEKFESEKAGLLNRVVEIGSRLNLRGQEQKEDQLKADALLANFKLKSGQLEQEGVSAVLLTDSIRMAFKANDDIRNCEFKHAIHNLELAMNLQTEAAEYYKVHSGEWLILAPKIPEFLKLARILVNWPPLIGSAQEQIADCNRVQSLFEETGNYKLCTEMFNELKLAQNHESLKKRSTSLLSKDGLPDPDELAAIKKHLQLKTDGIENQVGSIFNSPKFQDVKKKYAKSSDLDLIMSEFRKSLSMVHEKWRDYARSPDLRIDLIDVKAAQIELELKVLANGWLESDSIRIPQLLSKSNEPELNPIDVDLPGAISKLITKFEDQEYAEQSLRALELLNENVNTTKTQYEDFRKVLLKDLELEKSFKLKSIEEAEKKLDGATDLLQQIKERHKNFQGYQKQLEAELADIKLMIASGDPDMIKIANQSLNETLQRISEVHPDKRDDDAVRFSEVEKAWTELHKTLGEHNYVPIRMPETHEKLIKQLKTAEVLARKSSPAEGLKILEPLFEPVRAAREKAGKLNDEHERYKQQRRDFENEIEKARKETGTYYSERVIALRDYVNSRLNEAEKLRHTEKGLPDAFKMLNGLREMIREVMATPESEGGPVGKIRELDAKYYEEQLLIRDMARQFEIEVNDFKGPYLKIVKQTIEKNAKEGGVSEADCKDLLSMADGLAKQGESAIQLVKPYVASIQKVPHKTIGQDPGPDQAKAIEDFKAARSVLAEGRLTAERLMRSTATTNVLIAANRKEVEKFWINQINQFVSTINDTVRLVDEFKNNHPENTSCDDAKKLLEKVKGQFSQSAFTAPLKVLTDVPRPAMEKRLAAREEALKTMRQYREDVLRDPVLRKLTDQSNPLNQKKLLAAFGNLRVALKRIEIESLIGV